MPLGAPDFATPVLGYNSGSAYRRQSRASCPSYDPITILIFFLRLGRLGMASLHTGEVCAQRSFSVCSTLAMVQPPA